MGALLLQATADAAAVGKPCAPGKFSADGHAWGINRDCSDCPAGKYTFLGLTGQGACTGCPAGKWSFKGASGCGKCTRCEAPAELVGCSDTFARDAGECHCPKGHHIFSLSPTAPGVTPGGKHIAGSSGFSEPGRYTCKGCIPGQYMRESGKQTQCLPCVKCINSKPGGWLMQKPGESPIRLGCFPDKGPGICACPAGHSVSAKAIDVGNQHSWTSSSAKQIQLNVDCKECTAGSYLPDVRHVAEAGLEERQQLSQQCLPCANCASDDRSLYRAGSCGQRRAIEPGHCMCSAGR